LTDSNTVVVAALNSSSVDAAYTRKKFTGDADRVAFLFERYLEIAGAA